MGGEQQLHLTVLTVHTHSHSYLDTSHGSIDTAIQDRVKLKAFCLMSSPSLTDCLQPLKLYHNVACLAIYWYFHAYCSSELSNCMPLLLWPPCTHLSTQANPIHCPNPLCKRSQLPAIFHSFHWKILELSSFIYILPVLKLTYQKMCGKTTKTNFGCDLDLLFLLSFLFLNVF